MFNSDQLYINTHYFSWIEFLWCRAWENQYWSCVNCCSRHVSLLSRYDAASTACEFVYMCDLTTYSLMSLLI